MLVYPADSYSWVSSSGSGRFMRLARANRSATEPRRSGREVPMTTRMTIGDRFIPESEPRTMTEDVALSVGDRAVWHGAAAR